MKCEVAKQCNETETRGFNQETKEFLVEVNLMLKKFQDFVSILISSPNVLQGENIKFPMKTKLCTTKCTTDDSYCLEIKKTEPYTQRNYWG